MSETPLLDELEKGKWPSFVKEIKIAAERNKKAKGLLNQLETSYKDKKGHWKHGGTVSVKGYGGGIIGRFSDLEGETFKDASHFHTLRINQTSGWFYTSESLRVLMDIWDKYGSSLTNLHGSTGDLILLGADTDVLEPLFTELSSLNWDLGGSGYDIRTPSCCIGPARCEWACYDTLGLTYDLTMTYQDEIHRPSFPYKFKVKIAGCPNDCVASIARSDLAIIGIWKDNIKINNEEIKAYAEKIDIKKDVCDRCPRNCIEWDGMELNIKNDDCSKCMHCINLLPKALKIGEERGAAILVGAKAPLKRGAQLTSLIVPFMKMEPPYNELKGLIRKMWDFWDEHGKPRERIGELIQRVGLGNFIEGIGLKPIPEMVFHPRENPYISYGEYYEEQGNHP